MFRKIKKIFKNIKYSFSKECCYDEMKERGYAAEGKCGGLMGGDKWTEYLSYSCVGCPYLDMNYERCKR